MLSPAVLKEWDDRLDSMETLFDAEIFMEEDDDMPYEEALETVKKLRRLIRGMAPFENVPIVVTP